MNQQYLNRVFELAHLGIGFLGPSPLWAVVVVNESGVLAEASLLKYGNLSPLKKLQEHHLSGHYQIYSNLLFFPNELEKLTPSTIYFCNELSQHDLNKIRAEFFERKIDLFKVCSEEGKNLNKAFFYFDEHKIPYSEKILHSKKLNPAIRSGFDCVVFNKQVIEKSNDNFKALNNRFPLRVLLCPLRELDFNWNVLADEFRRNTMVITTHQDVLDNQEIVRMLEHKGIAQLGLEEVSEQVLLRALARYKFISVLFEN